MGLKRYFTGVPCQKAHVSERTVSKGDCAICLKTRQQAWNRVNADSVNERSRNWYAKNPEKAKETRAAWRERNAEKDRSDISAYQALNRDRLKEAAARWAASNRAKLNAKARHYAASKIRATPSWAVLDRIEALYAEALQKSVETGIPHQVDHFVPLRSLLVCGLHCEANLRVITARENQSKANRYWPDMPV